MSLVILPSSSNAMCVQLYLELPFFLQYLSGSYLYAALLALSELYFGSLFYSLSKILRLVSIDIILPSG